MNTKSPLENIALFDMDGTLCDFEGALRDHLALLNRGGPVDYLDPEVPVFTNEHESALAAQRRLIMRLPGFWNSFEPIPAGLALLDAAKEMGFNCHILTKGPSYATRAWMEKIEWCQKYVPDTPVTVTQDKGIVYGRILVDDYSTYMSRWLEWRPRGLGLMADVRENHNFEHPQVFKYNEENMDEAIELMRKQLR